MGAHAQTATSFVASLSTWDDGASVAPLGRVGFSVSQLGNILPHHHTATSLPVRRPGTSHSALGRCGRLCTGGWLIISAVWATYCRYLGHLGNGQVGVIEGWCQVRLQSHQHRDSGTLRHVPIELHQRTACRSQVLYLTYLHSMLITRASLRQDVRLTTEGRQEMTPRSTVKLLLLTALVSRIC